MSPSTLKKNLLTVAFVVAVGILLFRSLGVWIMGLLDGWVDMSPGAIVFLLPTPLAAFAALALGKRYSSNTVGRIGFFASAFLLSVWPGLIATLVVLYSVSKRPYLLTSVWTGLSAIISITPAAYYWIWDGGDLLYAGGFGAFLALTALVACIFLIISITSIGIHIIQKRKPNKAEMATPRKPSDQF